MNQAAQMPKIGVGVVIRRGSQVLLIKRQHVLGAGCWSTPGGHLEFGEAPEVCARREAQEETGVEITDVRFICLSNDIFTEDGRHYITIWMEGQYSRGEAWAAAPYEMSEAGWFDWGRLPEPLFLPLQNLTNGNTYPPGAFRP